MWSLGSNLIKWQWKMKLKLPEIRRNMMQLTLIDEIRVNQRSWYGKYPMICKLLSILQDIFHHRYPLCDTGRAFFKKKTDSRYRLSYVEIHWATSWGTVQNTSTNIKCDLWLKCGCGLLASGSSRWSGRNALFINLERSQIPSMYLESSTNPRWCKIFQSTFTPWWQFSHTWCGVNNKMGQAKSVKATCVFFVKCNMYSKHIKID